MKRNKIQDFMNINEGKTDEIVKVSLKAFNKLMTAAELMEDYEVRFISLADKDDPERLIRDFHLIDQQVVGGSSVDITAQDKYRDSYKIRSQGKIPVGIAHSHGIYDPFHSDTDQEEIQKVLKTYLGNTKKEHKLGFQFEQPKSALDLRENDRLFRSHNQLDLELLVGEEVKDKDLDRTLTALDIKVPQKITYSVSSIVVNKHCQDVFALRRFMERFFLITSQDEHQKYIKEISQHYPDECLVEDMKFSYSLNALVEVVDTGEEAVVDREVLLEELKQKIVFEDHDRPSSFYENEENINDYEDSDDYEEKEEEKVEEEDNKKEEYLPIEHQHTPPKRSFVERLKEKLSPKITKKELKPKPKIEKKVKERRKEEKVKEEVKEKAIEEPEQKISEEYSRIIKCDPIKKFDDIMDCYRRRSEDYNNNYKELSSVNKRVERFYEELVRDHNPDEIYCNTVESLLFNNKQVLEYEEKSFRQKTKDKEKGLKEREEDLEKILESRKGKAIKRKDKEIISNYVKDLREIRDNYYALGMEKEAIAVFNKILKLRGGPSYHFARK